MSTGSEAH